MRWLRFPALGSGVLFLTMLLVMQFDPDDYAVLDTLATNLVHTLQTPGWVEVFAVITWFGSVTGIGIAAALGALFLYRRPGLVLRLGALIAVESVSVQVVKSFIGRIRPDALPEIGALHSFSFPSGHATSAIAIYGFLAVVLLPRIKQRSIRIGLGILIALLVLGIGISRIVLAAHYSSDVLAGYFLGAFWLSLTLLTMR